MIKTKAWYFNLTIYNHHTHKYIIDKWFSTATDMFEFINNEIDTHPLCEFNMVTQSQEISKQLVKRAWQVPNRAIPFKGTNDITVCYNVVPDREIPAVLNAYVDFYNMKISEALDRGRNV